MRSRTIVLSLAVILLFLGSVYIINAGCCFNPSNPSNFCKPVSEEECCDGPCPQTNPPTYDPSVDDCTGTRCQTERCCETATDCSVTTYQQCIPYEKTFHWDAYNCSDPLLTPNCVQGCCIYLNEQDEILGKSIKTKRSCDEVTAYPKTVFQPGVSGTQCTSQGETTLNKGTVKGYVLDSSKAIMKNAYVESVFEGKTVSVDPSTGEYVLQLSAAEHTLKASVSGYVPVTDKIQVLKNQVVYLNFTLTEQSLKGAVKGKVTDSSGSPITTARIFWGGGAERFTDKEGNYLFENVISGPQNFQAFALGYNPSSKSIDVQPGIENTLDFVLAPKSEGSYCGDNIRQTPNSQGQYEQCDGTDSASCPGMCHIDCTCKDTCSKASGYCFDFEYQCSTAGGSKIEIPSGVPFSCQDEGNRNYGSYGCCDKPVSPIPHCVYGTYNDRTISEGLNLAPTGGTMCECGGQFYDTSNPYHNRGYCCYVDNRYTWQATPCSGSNGRIKGYIKSEIGDPIFTAKIQVGNYISYSDSSGYYQLDIPSGTYDMVVSKSMYEPAKVSVDVFSDKITEKDIVLKERDTSCDGKIRAPKLVLKNIQGKPDINITWEQQCRDLVSRFIIRRGDLPIAFMDPFDNYYLDKNLEWETDYEYTVEVVTDEHGTNKSKEKINTGDKLCEGVSGSICLSKNLDDSYPRTKMAYCDDTNNVEITHVCEAGEICVGPVDGNVWCTGTDECADFGTDYDNVFGLYSDRIYDGESCTEDSSGNPKYCYYDASSTSVDKCMMCRQTDTCYEYHSQSACLEDNCFHSSEGCKWKWTYYREFGKGICYEENYTGTDKCSLCSPDSPIFENTECTPDVCDLLGNCFSSAGYTSCEGCKSQMSCSEYSDKASCIGAGSQEFSIPGECGSSENLVYSADSCGLGRCKWDDLNEICYKDGNDDDIIDCGSDTSCLIDNTPPFSSVVSKPDFISQSKGTIEFDTNGVELYYCVAEGSCCPEAIAVGNSVTLPNDDFPLKDINSNMYINFYAIDANDNVEQIRKELIYVDTVPPNLSVNYAVMNASSSETLSDLYINLTVSEKAVCHANLTKGAEIIKPIAMKNRMLNASSPNTVSYLRIGDGSYFFVAMCEDDRGNRDSVVVPISIDRVHKIYGEKVNGEFMPDMGLTLGTDNIILEFRNSDNDFCRYRQTYPANTSWNYMNPESFKGQGKEQSDGSYLYDINFALGRQSGTYGYEAQCWNDSTFKSPAVLTDKTNFMFTVDVAAPETQILIEEGSAGVYLPFNDSYYYQNPRVKFECQDPDLGPPEEFGCDKTYYCISNVDCVPSESYDKNPLYIFSGMNSSTYHLCYRSVDKGGISENIKCVEFNIDNHVNPVDIILYTPYGSKDLKKVTRGKTEVIYYNITVRADEPITIVNNGNDYLFKYNVPERGSYNNSIYFVDASPDRKEWYFRMRIPLEHLDFKDLEGNNSEFSIYYIDDHGNIGKGIHSGKFFEIDTKGPDKPLVSPEIEDGFRTRLDYINITGMIDPEDPGIRVIANLSGNVHIVNSMEKEIPKGYATVYDPSNLNDEGRNWILVDNDKRDEFSPGSFVAFTNHNRTSFKRYKILSARYYDFNDYTNITFESPLESNAENDEVIHSYSLPGPQGWFGINMMFENFNRGENTLWIYGVDDIGNVGRIYKKKITYDKFAFDVLLTTPYNGTVTGDKNLALRAVLHDKDMSLSLNNLKVMINGEEHKCREGDLRCEILPNNKYDISYSPPIEWDDGEYYVTLSGSDNIGNERIERWQFEIDSSAPLGFDFSVHEASYTIPYWYLNHSDVTVNLTFRGDADITSVSLKNHSEISVSCDSSDYPDVVCTFSKSLDDGTYELDVVASKPGGSVGRWKEYFVVDTTPPTVEFDDIPPTNNYASVKISGKFYDKNIDEYGIIRIGSGSSGGNLGALSVASVESTGTLATLSISENRGHELPGLFTATVSIPQGEDGGRTVMAVAKDKAGNKNHVSYTVYLDTRFEGMEGNFNVTYNNNSNGLIIKRGNIFATNITAVKGVTIVNLAKEKMKLNLYRNGMKEKGPMDIEGKFRLDLTLERGPNNLTLDVKDLAGNKDETPYKVNVVLDKEGPGVKFDILSSLYDVLS